MLNRSLIKFYFEDEITFVLNTTRVRKCVLCEQERHGPFGFQSIRDDICELVALDMDVVVLGAPSR